MSRVRGKNTGIEKIVFRFLRKNRIHFQPHYFRILGKPDVAIPSRKIAIFIDGDFWHGYQYPKWIGRIPKKYWRHKIQANIERDRKNRSALRRKGWRVLRIWGHEIASRPTETLSRVEVFISGDKK